MKQLSRILENLITFLKGVIITELNCYIKFTQFFVWFKSEQMAKCFLWSKPNWVENFYCVVFMNFQNLSNFELILNCNTFLPPASPDHNRVEHTTCAQNNLRFFKLAGLCYLHLLNLYTQSWLVRTRHCTMRLQYCSLFSSVCKMIK